MASKVPHGDASVSNISSVTSNTESSETLTSLQTATTENAARGKLRVKVQQGSWVTDSFARTICNGAFNGNKHSQDNSIVAEPDEQGEKSSFTTKVWNFLPSCYTANNDALVVAKAETDDRSDVALNVLSDIDTIEPLEDEEVAKATVERSEQRTTLKSKHFTPILGNSKRSRSFLGFRRRNRSEGSIFS